MNTEDSTLAMSAISHWAERAGMTAIEEFARAGAEIRRPCVLFRPHLSQDGNQWCALYGDNLQEGSAGFGATPEKAMVDFDIQWLNARAKEPIHG